MDSLIGRRLGQYELIEQLGEGGMAAVYRARQQSIKRDVAIKIIRPGLGKGDFSQRFEREVETIASLNHPHIVKVFDYGQQDDILYIVMELQPGSLASLIEKEQLTGPRILQLLNRISSALDYAHSEGIVHRDLKPDNVLLDKNGYALLTDFGIAKVINETALTQSGLAMGTPAYMSPEQWQAEPIDGRADIYALGVMLFEMLSRQRPFNADTPFAMMHMHIYKTPPPIRTIRPDLPVAVEHVLNKTLAKSPEDRYQSARELFTALRDSFKNDYYEAPAPIPPRRQEHEVKQEYTPPSMKVSVLAQPSAPQSRPVSQLVIIGGLAALVIIALVVFLILKSVNSPQQVAAPTLSATALSLSGVSTMTTIQAANIPPPTVVPVSTTPGLILILTSTDTPEPTSPVAPISTTANGLSYTTQPTIALSDTATTPAALVAAVATATPMSTVEPPTLVQTETQILPTLTKIADTLDPTAISTDTGTPSFTPVPPTTSFTSTAQSSIAVTQSAPNYSGATSHVVAQQATGILSIAFSPDGKMILTGSLDKMARLWDAQSGQLLQTFNGHTDSVTSVAFSPDGKMILTGSLDKTARLWDAQNGQLLRTLSGHPDLVASVAFSPDGKTVLTASTDNARSWNVSNGKVVQIFSGHSDLINSVAFSPNGKMVLTGSLDKTARLWDAQSGQLLRTLSGHTDGVTSVAFSPDGKMVLTGSLDKTARLWDAQSGQLLRTLSGHTDGVTSVAFSPDGNAVITGSVDKSVCLWDTGNGKKLQALDGNTDQVTSVVFSPDGLSLAAGSIDRTVRVWTFTAP